MVNLPNKSRQIQLEPTKILKILIASYKRLVGIVFMKNKLLERFI